MSSAHQAGRMNGHARLLELVFHRLRRMETVRMNTSIDLIFDRLRSLSFDSSLVRRSSSAMRSHPPRPSSTKTYD